MKYIIYAAVALLILWAVVYLARHIRRQLRGEGGCGGDCAVCHHCGGSCGRTGSGGSELAGGASAETHLLRKSK